MNLRLPVLFAAACLAVPALAFPPAPAHEVLGTVRAQNGRPLDSSEGTVILYNSANLEITRSFTDPLVSPGMNYRLSVPMDSGSFGALYQANALVMGNDYTIRVVINGVVHVPIQFAAQNRPIGAPGEQTVLDLFLGVDSDGDGLPDFWEQLLVDGDFTGNLLDITDVEPQGDLDNDGMTNLQEFMLGTYALGAGDALAVTLESVGADRAKMRFRGIRGRRYGVEVSTNLVNWFPSTLSLSASGTLGASFSAESTGTQRIYAPVESPDVPHYFRIHAR